MSRAFSHMQIDVSFELLDTYVLTGIPIEFRKLEMGHERRTTREKQNKVVQR